MKEREREETPQKSAHEPPPSGRAADAETRVLSRAISRAFARPALVLGAASIGLVALAALSAAAVRLLPWFLDPSLPLAVTAPFARSLVLLALEASILSGWPIGWALAAHRLNERGEARALLALGERPRETVARLLPQGLIFGAALGVVSMLGAQDAAAPGRVVGELLSRGRAHCAEVREPTMYAVPFVDATWLCAPSTTPRLLGHGPGPLAPVVFTATDARVSSDLRRVDLVDARVAVEPAPVKIAVGTLTLRGLPPWARASIVPALFRAILLVLAAFASATLAAHAALTGRGRRAREGDARAWGRARAILVGAVGPLAALALLRALERAAPDDASTLALLPFLAVPIAAAAAVLVTAAVLLLAQPARD